MSIQIRRSFLAVAAIATAGLILASAVGPVVAAQPADPLVAEATPQLANGVKPCEAQRAAAKDKSAAHLQKLGDCEIDRRLATLSTLDTRVSSAAALTGDHRSALRAQYAAARTGLTALRATIDRESDATVLRADLKRIATDYRIYLLVVPKSAEVIAADAELAAVSRRDDAAARLQARIDTAKAAGKDVTTAQAALDAMTAKLEQVTPAVGGIPGAVLPLTAAQYNAGTAKPVLVSSRQALQRGRSLLAGARADNQACVAALRAIR